MTPEQQRIAIAEVCGWTHLRVTHNLMWGTAPNTDYSDKPEHWYAGCPGDQCNVPDYLSDLNAMHEAESFLNGQQQINYTNELDVVVFTNGLVPSMATRMHIIQATAAQRAEAFLRTLGLWK